jgi:hypothetical protein
MKEKKIEILDIENKQGYKLILINNKKKHIVKEEKIKEFLNKHKLFYEKKDHQIFIPIDEFVENLK